MRSNDYVKLEKDYHFKKSYLNNTLWWKNILMIAPICFLFVGLAGILYLFNLDKLISLYLIPYLIFFVIGTILLKAIKKHIQKTMMATQGAFHICLAKPIGEKEGYTYVAFANDTHRHDKQYIANLIKDISFETLFNEQQESFKKSSILIQENEKDIYVRAYFNKDIDKRNNSWREDGLIPVLYIDNKYTPVIKKKDLIVR